MTQKHRFIKSTFCESGTCVEVAIGKNEVIVRNSQHPNEPSVAFTTDEWGAFIKGVNAGEFSKLT